MQTVLRLSDFLISVSSSLFGLVVIKNWLVALEPNHPLAFLLSAVLDPNPGRSLGTVSGSESRPGSPFGHR